MLTCVCSINKSRRNYLNVALMMDDSGVSNGSVQVASFRRYGTYRVAFSDEAITRHSSAAKNSASNGDVAECITSIHNF